ncbi:MAG: HD domain-containing phosphohydrolase [Planctomycetota bacterium]|nr:HD domain-containing phosphohydrolase [Planctomycetota bacterium]
MSSSDPVRRVSAFTHELVVGLINLEMHGAKSQELADSISSLMDELSALFAEGHSDPLQIDIGESCIFYDGTPLTSASLQARKLISLCTDRKIHHLRISPRVKPEELRSFLVLLSTSSNYRDFCTGHGTSILSKAGVSHIDVAAPSLHSKTSAAHCSTEELERYQRLADCLQENHIAAFQGHDLEIEEACGAIDAALNEANAPAGLLALASHDFIDSFTVGHSVRVALLALQVASVGGASRQDLVRVGTAGLLHDIGKSRIPQEVLFKQGRLTEEEREIMSQHPRLGGEVLLEQPQLDPAAIGAAFCHHMKPHGGYPVASLPFEPSGISKLVQVCDVFEALTAVRPYKRAMTPLEAYTVMYRNEHDFDPQWLRFFVQALGVYPQGTFLTLDTGEVSVVTEQGIRPTQPIVKILTGPDGEPLLEHESLTCELGEVSDGMIRNVQEDTPGNPIVTALLDPDNADPNHEHQDTGIVSCCGEDLVEE